MIAILMMFAVILIIEQTNKEKNNFCKTEIVYKIKKIYMNTIIEVKDGIYYDTEKSFDDQSTEFKEYAMQLYEAIPKLPYPEFDTDGNIAYSTSDAKINYTFLRIQQNSFSKSDRAVRQLITTITVKEGV